MIPGFQGISSNKEILLSEEVRRYSSCNSKIFNTDTCEIYTDVDGVYSSDPNNVPVAKKIEKIAYEEMLELSSLGAKVMQSSAVQTAMMYNIPLQVRSLLQIEKEQKFLAKRH